MEECAIEMNRWGSISWAIIFSLIGMVAGMIIMALIHKWEKK